MATETKLELRSRSVGPWPMNTYVVVCPVTRHSVLIDPGAEPETLQEMLADTQPVAILLTHTHGDHIGALDEMRTALKVPLMAHAGPHVNGVELQTDRTLAHGDTVDVGNGRLKVYYTPGHTEDMLSFELEGNNQIVVGDTLFAGGPGKTWSPAGFQTMLQTLRNVVLLWPDDSVCYAGHGPHFRLDDKRAAIEAFVAKDHGDFFGDAEW